MENIEKCECWVGVLHDYDDTRVVDLKELKNNIQEQKEYAEWESKMYGVNEKYYTLADYCDKRKSTDLTRFNYCPLCGKKIDWKAIKGGANG